MMALSSIQNTMVPIRYTQETAAKPQGERNPLNGRVCCDWKKNFLVSNIAFVLTSIFFSLFWQLPVLGVAAGFLALFQFAVYQLSLKQEAHLPSVGDYQLLQKTHSTVQEQLQQEKKKHTQTEANWQGHQKTWNELNEKNNKELGELRKKPDLSSQVEILTKEKKTVEDQLTTKNKEIEEFKKKQITLQNENQNLKTAYGEFSTLKKKNDFEEKRAKELEQKILKKTEELQGKLKAAVVESGNGEKKIVIQTTKKQKRNSLTNENAINLTNQT